MNTVRLRDKEELERFLRKDVYLNLYGIGDLDDFFWPYTTWHALTENDQIKAVALLYTGQVLPTLLALSREVGIMKDLLCSINHTLPDRFYAHLSPGVEDALKERFEITSHGKVCKMALKDVSLLNDVDCSMANRLSGKDLGSLLEFYRESYPGNWFDPRMLETEQYFGITVGNRLVSVAGIHVYSRPYRVAALGNIATLPEYRKRGYGTRVTAQLCRSLRDTADHIGLNVKAENIAAISCYQKLGFAVVAAYEEFSVEAK